MLLLLPLITGDLRDVVKQAFGLEPYLVIAALRAAPLAPKYFRLNGDLLVGRDPWGVQVLPFDYDGGWLFRFLHKI